MKRAWLALSVLLAGCGAAPKQRMIYFFQPVDPVATGRGTSFRHIGKDWVLELDIDPGSIRFLLHNQGESPLRILWPVEDGGAQDSGSAAPPGGVVHGSHALSPPLLPLHAGDGPDPVGSVIVVRLRLRRIDLDENLLFRYRVVEAHERD